MAIGNVANVAVQNDAFYAGYVEVLQNNADIFNSASAGSIILETNLLRGYYSQERFWSATSGSITRRDLTSNSAITPTGLTQKEEVSVKRFVKGAYSNTYESLTINNDYVDAFGSEEAAFAYLVGRQAASEIAEKLATDALAAGRAALTARTAVTLDLTSESTTTFTHSALNRALALMGDASYKVGTLVMHSNQFHDLVGTDITDKITNVADSAIKFGVTSFAGRNIIVTDNASLIATGDTPDSYYILGLTNDAIRVKESEERRLKFDTTTLTEQLAMVAQLEMAYNVGVKGFAWDTTNGGANPTDTAFATSTNWDQVAASDKSGPGFLIKCQSSADL